MLVAILFLLLSIVGIIIFVPPLNLIIVFINIFLISLTSLLIIKLITNSKKYSYLISFYIFIILSLLTLDLFDPVNVILSISLFVGILILIK